MFEDNKESKLKKFSPIFFLALMGFFVYFFIYFGDANKKAVDEEFQKLDQNKQSNDSLNSVEGLDQLYCILIDKLVEETKVYKEGSHIDKIGVDLQSFTGVSSEEANNIIAHLNKYSDSIYQIEPSSIYDSKLIIIMYIYFYNVKIINNKSFTAFGSIDLYSKSVDMEFYCVKNKETDKWEIIRARPIS